MKKITQYIFKGDAVMIVFSDGDVKVKESKESNGRETDDKPEE